MKMMDKEEARLKKVKENVIESIKSIGQDLINRAEDISNDLDDVTSITIYSRIENGVVINYDVTKNYMTNFNLSNGKEEE